MLWLLMAWAGLSALGVAAVVYNAHHGPTGVKKRARDCLGRVRTFYAHTLGDIAGGALGALTELISFAIIVACLVGGTVFLLLFFTLGGMCTLFGTIKRLTTKWWTMIHKRGKQ